MGIGGKSLHVHAYENERRWALAASAATVGNCLRQCVVAGRSRPAADQTEVQVNEPRVGPRTPRLRHGGAEERLRLKVGAVAGFPPLWVRRLPPVEGKT